MCDVKSALRGLVPGEMFFAPRLAVEGFTTRAGSRETRTGQLVAYARSIDRGYGLEGWDGTEDPATAFRDGAADVVDGRGEPDRVDTGLVVFTGDASHCSVAQDLDDDVVGLPGAYKRGRAATFGASARCVNGCFEIKTEIRRDARTRKTTRSCARAARMIQMSWNLERFPWFGVGFRRISIFKSRQTA